MFNIGLEPDAVTMNALVDGLCRDGEFARAVRMVRDMLARGDETIEYAIGVVVKWLCRSGNSDMAMEFAADAEERGCRLNGVLCSIPVSTICAKKSRRGFGGPWDNEVEGRLSERFDLQSCALRASVIMHRSFWRKSKLALCPMLSLIHLNPRP